MSLTKTEYTKLADPKIAWADVVRLRRRLAHYATYLDPVHAGRFSLAFTGQTVTLVYDSGRPLYATGALSYSEMMTVLQRKICLEERHQAWS